MDQIPIEKKVDHIINTIENKPVREGNLCPHCEKGIVEYCGGGHMMDIAYLMCDNCDSTYPYGYLSK